MSTETIDFSRPIPLFPLPNCVLFPGVVQPLHIFEPRYREMIADALDDQSVIAIGLLKGGWEKSYYDAPPIHSIVCAGKIVAHEKLEDGKYNLLLHGVARAEILAEFRNHPYRTADLAPRFEKELTDMPAHRRILQRMLEETALRDLTVTATITSLFADEKMPTARLLDLLAYTFVQDPADKQVLLEELDPVQRCEKVMRAMVALAATMDNTRQPAKSHWHPPLSPN